MKSMDAQAKNPMDGQLSATGTANQLPITHGLADEALSQARVCGEALAYFRPERLILALAGWFAQTNRYCAESSSRKSALSAWYLAAGRPLSEPCMTTAPSDVQTCHRHPRPRFFTTTSKSGN